MGALPSRKRRVALDFDLPLNCVTICHANDPSTQPAITARSSGLGTASGGQKTIARLGRRAPVRKDSRPVSLPSPLPPILAVVAAVSL